MTFHFTVFVGGRSLLRSAVFGCSCVCLLLAQSIVFESLSLVKQCRFYGLASLSRSKDKIRVEYIGQFQNLKSHIANRKPKETALFNLSSVSAEIVMGDVLTQTILHVLVCS